MPGGGQNGEVRGGRRKKGEQKRKGRKRGEGKKEGRTIRGIGRVKLAGATES